MIGSSKNFRGLRLSTVYKLVGDDRWTSQDVQAYIAYAKVNDLSFDAGHARELWEFHLERKSARQQRKMREFAINYGADTALLTMATNVRQPASFSLPRPTPKFFNDVAGADEMIAHQQPKKETTMNPQEQLKQAQDAVIAAEKAVADAAIKAAFDARINREIELANATATMLQQVKHTIGAAPRVVFATFRGELNPLALTYGYKLVLVGDKSSATLVKV